MRAFPLVNRLAPFGGFAALAAVSCLVSACGNVDLTQMTINKIEFQLDPSVVTNGVVPGGSYEIKLKITVKDDHNEIHEVDQDQIDYSQISWTSDTMVRTDDGHLVVSKSNLRNWREGYAIEARVNGNPYHGDTLQLNTDWAHFNELSYAGGTGRPGGNGPDLTVAVARAVAGVNDMYRLIKVVSSSQSEPDWVVVPESNLFKLQSVGGAGVAGGSGSNGTRTSHPDGHGHTTYTCTPGSRGHDGSNGGNGGSVSYSYYTESSRIGMQFLALGGAGGAGGRGGSAATGCSGGSHGSSGQAGADGIVAGGEYSRANVEALFHAADNQPLDLHGMRIVD